VAVAILDGGLTVSRLFAGAIPLRRLSGSVISSSVDGDSITGQVCQLARTNIMTHYLYCVINIMQVLKNQGIAFEKNVRFSYSASVLY
jgi:hypothetical protein